jgi:hypothetical protein
MPQDPAGYVHRIGRTGRANKAGASISLVSFIFNMVQAQIVACFDPVFCYLCPRVLLIGFPGVIRGESYFQRD